MKHKGFTVVELIVVIVVIILLATITIVSYSFVREDAMDTKIRGVVKTVGDAIALREGQVGNRTGLALGYFSNANGVDSLAPAYLKTGYRDGITSKNATSFNSPFRYYGCSDGSGGFVVYASLNNPTADDISTFNKIRTACGHTNAQAPDTGNPQYNYAQVF